MRTVYLGTSDFAVAVLRRLAESPHRPALVVTRPDRPKGRGRRVQPPPVAVAAAQLGIELFQPESVNDEQARARIAAADPDAVLIAAFGALIREPLLSEHEMLNVHPSLLPRWRGAAPVERTLEAGDERTGVTIIKPTADLDAGPIALARAEPVAPDDDYGTLSTRLAAIGGELLVEALDTRPELTPQPEDGVTYAPKIESPDRQLDPGLGPEALANRVRALTPHVGARIELPGGGGALGVTRARPAAGEPAPPPGELAAAGDRLLYGASGGALELLVVQPPGKRPMDAAAYLRGHAVAGAPGG